MSQDNAQNTTQEGDARPKDFSTQRMKMKYHFNDPNMDLFFLGCLGGGPAGGLSAGEAFYVASQITDGDVDSWASAFERQGIALNAQADSWKERGMIRAAGEARLKAFACYRFAWQFVAPGERFIKLFNTHQVLFDQAMEELKYPVTKFSIPYGSGQLPGHFFKGTDPDAPTLLLIGGADTCHEDRFFSPGRYFIDRGYSVALVDLPGQGLTQNEGLHWESEVEKPVGLVIDELVSRFGVKTDKLALLGMSLGGYFACRSASCEKRLAAVIATSPLPVPFNLFSRAAKQAAISEAKGEKFSEVAIANMKILMWKAGVTEVEDLITKWEGKKADPALVEMPFLSVVGEQEGDVWKQEAQQWHESIPSAKKKYLALNAESGADVHCQGNNPLRLAQEVDAWLREVLY